MNALIYKEKYVYIWIDVASVWKDWKKKKNSLKLNVSKIKPDIKSGKPFKNIFFLILRILYFCSSFRRNCVSCCHPLISISSSFLNGKKIEYITVISVTIAVLQNQDFKDSKQN